jgi:hypothetical protein
VRAVDVELRDGRLERAPRVAREADVRVEHWPARERLALLREDGVGRVCFDRGGVRVRLPDCARAGAGEIESNRIEGERAARWRAGGGGDG